MGFEGVSLRHCSRQRHNPRHLSSGPRTAHRTGAREHKDEPRPWAVSVDYLSRLATSCYTPISITMGTPSSPVSQGFLLHQAYCGLTRGSMGILPASPGGVPSGGRVGSVATAPSR